MLHRVEDIETLSSCRFFAFTDRLISYQGAVRFAFERENAEEQARKPSSPNKSYDAQTRHFTDIKHNPELSQYFD